MNDFLTINKNNEINFIIKNNYTEFEEFKELIINYLEINNKNLLKIKINDLNINRNNDFYAYINNYKFNKLISYLLGILYNKYIYDDISIFEIKRISYINEVLDSDGIYIHNELIDDNICENIICQLNKKDYIKNWTNDNIFFNFDIFNSMPGTIWIKDQKDVILINEIQKIVSDSFILNIAQNYLKCKPILAQTYFWISKPGFSDQSNYFHQDYDDVNFLKIFIYLTDVNENNGAHSYIKGSLNNMITPENYKPSDRLTDDFAYKNYDNNNILNICGKRGTIIFENTNGFHKGNILKDDYRFMLQLQYCSSTNFLTNGINFINNLNKDDNIILYNAKIKYPDTFILYNFD
jgi:hypothetical protein